MRRNEKVLGGLVLLGAMAFTLGSAVAGTEDGSCLEPFELVNFQPQSPTFEELVQSSSYHQRTTIIMLLSSG